MRTVLIQYFRLDVASDGRHQTSFPNSIDDLIMKKRDSATTNAGSSCTGMEEEKTLTGRILR
jgi:hypothetical protein